MSENFHIALQQGSEAVHLPDPGHCKAGDTFTVQYKNAGQVVRTATFFCYEIWDDGELFRRWRQE